MQGNLKSRGISLLIVVLDRIESVQLVRLNDEEKQPVLVSAGHDGLVKFWNLTK